MFVSSEETFQSVATIQEAQMQLTPLPSKVSGLINIDKYFCMKYGKSGEIASGVPQFIPWFLLWLPKSNNKLHLSWAQFS